MFTYLFFSREAKCGIGQKINRGRRVWIDDQRGAGFNRVNPNPVNLNCGTNRWGCPWLV